MVTSPAPVSCEYIAAVHAWNKRMKLRRIGGAVLLVCLESVFFVRRLVHGLLSYLVDNKINHQQGFTFLRCRLCW